MCADCAKLTVVTYHAIAVHFHTELLCHLAQQLKILVAVLILAKNIHSSITSIDNVVLSPGA